VKRINFEDFCVDLERKIDFQCEFYDGILGDQTITLKPDQLKPVIDVIFETFDYFHLSAITVQQREAVKMKLRFFIIFGVVSDFLLC
jgi:hypothetical protein